MFKEGSAPHGSYRVFVQNYSSRSNAPNGVECKVRLLINDDEKECKVCHIQGELAGSNCTVFEFQYPYIEQRKKRSKKPPRKTKCVCSHADKEVAIEDVGTYAELQRKVQFSFNLSFITLHADWKGWGKGHEQQLRGQSDWEEMGNLAQVV